MPTFVVAGLDGALAALALVATYFVAFDVGHDPQFALYARQIAPILPVVVLLRVACLSIFGLYRPDVRFLGGADLIALAKAVALGSALLIGVGFALRFLPDALPIARDDTGQALRLPWRIVIIEGAFALLLLGAARFGRRLLLAQQARRGGRPRVLVVGDGPEARGAIHQMLNAADGQFSPAALVVSPGAEAPRSLHGVPVETAEMEGLDGLLAKHDAAHVLLAPSAPDVALLRRAVRATTHGRVRFHLLPSVEGVISSTNAGTGPRELRLEDLLRRDEVRLKPNGGSGAGAAYVADKTVLVTGAGGSIGGEIARQLCALGSGAPARLFLLDHSENGIFELQSELQRDQGGTSAESSPPALDFQIADIGDGAAMERLFRATRPDIVFHAAAHKHVPLMERQPAVALRNNTLATRRLARLARDCGVERFILISTDKAVRPSSVMGASKRLAERAVWLEAEAIRADTAHTDRRFCAVRFGNVLGSRGSVVPLFQRQIAAGGPLTVTDPEMTRYFMTGPEAAALVIAVGGLGANGHLYLLDMGEPIRLVDLARDLIRLSGHAPDDIEIAFTGVRPGEKIVEDLLIAGESVETTAHPKIRQVVHEPFDMDAAREALDFLEELLAREPSDDELRGFLRGEIDDFAAP